jgi:hypothetical protein
MTTEQSTPEAASSEIEVSSPVVWEAFIYDESGFVISDSEDIDAILAAWPDEEAIDRQFGDMHPSQVVIVSGSALPAERWGNLRAPSSWTSEDRIFDYSLYDFHGDLPLLWARVQAMAEALSKFERHLR